MLVNRQSICSKLFIKKMFHLLQINGVEYLKVLIYIRKNSFNFIITCIFISLKVSQIKKRDIESKSQYPI